MAVALYRDGGKAPQPLTSSAKSAATDEVAAPAEAPIAIEGGRLLHQEASLRLYEVPGERMKPYPGMEHMAGAPMPNGVRQWVMRILARFRVSKVVNQRAGKSVEGLAWLLSQDSDLQSFG